MQYMKWYLILNWTLIRDGQFWKCEETNSFYTLSQISFLMYLSQSFVLSSRCQDLPDVKNWENNEERKWDNTKMEVAYATKFLKGERRQGRKGRSETKRFLCPPLAAVT